MTSILNLKCFWNESCWILGLESKRPDNWSGFFGRFPHIPCKTRLSVWWRKQSTNHQSPIWMIACFAPVGPFQDPSLLATLKCFSSPKGNCDTNLAQSCSEVKLTFISSPEKPLVTDAKLKELSNIYHLNPPRNLTLIPFLQQTWSFGQHSNKNCTLWVPNMESSLQIRDKQQPHFALSEIAVWSVWSYHQQEWAWHSGSPMLGLSSQIHCAEFGNGGCFRLSIWTGGQASISPLHSPVR